MVDLLLVLAGSLAFGWGMCCSGCSGLQSFLYVVSVWVSCRGLHRDVLHSLRVGCPVQSRWRGFWFRGGVDCPGGEPERVNSEVK
jgi:hypothetical protein